MRLRVCWFHNKFNTPFIYKFTMLFFSEFIPYVFQLLSLLLELHDTSVPDAYLQMLPNLLLPPLWERLANIPPLVRLLQAFIEKGAAQIETEKIVSIMCCCYYSS